MNDGQTVEIEPRMESSDRRDRSSVSFSAREIGRIVLAIVKGVERSEAICAMPRYSPDRHEAYAAFYDQIKDGIDITWREE